MNANWSSSTSDSAVASVPRITEDFHPHLPDPSKATTTHDVHGGGDPRLVASIGDGVGLDTSPDGALVPATFPLLPGRTTIGSDPESDLVLFGLAPHQAEVRRDVMDEYRIFDVSPDRTTLVDGRRAVGQSLHSGDRVSLGPLTFVYARAEFADHGSPYGGHDGGLPHGYRPWQPTPFPRGTSVHGGREPSADDPGEYY